MTDKEYQADYYQRVTKKKRKGRWSTDTDYRENEQARARRRRALKRAQTADERFEAAILAKKAQAKGTLIPRDVWIDGDPVRCYSSGSLAREIGRESRTIRLWLRQRVLPGATVFFAVKTTPDAYFSRGFCAAVKRACRRLYRLDARLPKDKLRGLVLEELAREGESYVPVGGTEDDRVWPGNKTAAKVI
jgi:hypothetical protein